MEETTGTTIVIATAEPTIKPVPIEEMLALPEAPSAPVAEKERHKEFPAFLSYLFEEGYDAFEEFQTPFMDTMAKLLSNRRAHEASEFRIPFVRNPPGAGLVYKPPDPPAGPSPIEDIYKAFLAADPAYERRAKIAREGTFQICDEAAMMERAKALQEKVYAKVARAFDVARDSDHGVVSVTTGEQVLTTYEIQNIEPLPRPEFRWPPLTTYARSLQGRSTFRTTAWCMPCRALPLETEE